MAKTKAAVTITRDDWLKAVDEVSASQADADSDLMSYFDFAELAGIAPTTASHRLNALAAAGRAIRTTKRIIAGDGKCRRVVAFRLVKK